MADKLEIQIDVAAAKAALDSLSASFVAFKAAATASTADASTAIERLNTAMTGIKSINKSVLDSLTQFNTAVANLNTGAIGSAAASLGTFGSQANAVNTAATSVKSLGKALQTITVPPGVSAITANFNQISAAAVNVTRNTNQLSQSQRTVNAAFQSLGAELGNAIGYMGGFGTTTGNIIRALSTLSQQGVTVTGIFQGLQTQFGTFGAVGAIIAGVGLGMKGLVDAATSLLSPIIQVSTQFQTFNNAIDALRGNGAGAEAMTALQKIAKDTSTDILTLTKSYTEFEAAAKNANISADQSVKIFAGVSTALRATGASAQSSQEAFLALTQMMSKGQVQMQELKLQLGNAIPGAFEDAAAAMGVTTAQLNKMVTAGALLPQVFIPTFAAFENAKWGDAVAKQAASASGQIQQMSNALTNLMAAMGGSQGGIGLLTPLAAGFKALQEALNSESLRAFAAVLGEVVGLITGSVLSAVGGFITGLTSLFNLLAAGASAVLNAVSGWGAFGKALEDVATLLGGFQGIFQVIGTALGVLAGAWILQRTLSLAAAAAYGIYAVASGAASGASGILTVAIGALNLALMSNPILAWVGILGIAAGAAYTLFNALTPATAAVKEHTAAISAAQITTRGYTDDLQEFATSTKMTADGIAASALSFQGYDAAVKDAQGTLQLLKDQINNVNVAQKANEDAMKSAKIQQDQWVGGIRAANLELGRRRSALQSEATGYQQEITALRDGASRQKAYGQAVTNNSRSMVGLKSSINDTRDSITAINAEIRNNSNAIATSNNAFSARMGREKEWTNSLSTNKEALEQQARALQEWKVPLDESSQAMASQFVALGKSKDEAGQLAYTIQTLTQTESQRTDALQQQIAKNQAIIDITQRYIDQLRAQIAANNDLIKSDPANAGYYRTINSGLEGGISSLTKWHDEAAVSQAEQIALNDSLDKHTGIAQEAAAQQERLANEYGISADKAKLAQAAISQIGTAIGQIAPKADGAAKGVDAIGDAGNNAAGGLDDTKKAAEGSATGMQTAQKAAAAVAADLDAAKATFKQVGDAFSILSDNSKLIAAALPSVAAQLTPLTTTFDTFAISLPKVNFGFDTFQTTCNQLQTSLPVIGTAMNTIVAAFTTGTPMITGFKDGLVSIGAQSANIDAVRAAVAALVTWLTDSAKVIADATTTLGGLGRAAGSVKDGFDKASTGADAFSDKMTNLLSPIQSVIDKMGELKTAADNALAAAKAASAANSDGGGGGDTTSGHGGRHGGLSSTGLDGSSFTVPTSAFNSAPHFRDGTANTSRFVSKIPNGGIPSILHPNEAVIPLSKGRTIPVSLSYTDLPTQQMSQSSEQQPDHMPLMRIAQSLNASTNALSATQKQLAIMNATPMDQPSAQTIEVNKPTQVPTLAELNTPSPNAANSSMVSSPDGLVSPSANVSTDSASNSGRTQDSQANHIVVNVEVKAQDLDSFNRSQDQIARALQSKITKATRRLK